MGKARSHGAFPALWYADPVELDETQRVLVAMERHGVRYAVFGAVALNIHGFVRATEDLDIFVAPDAENISALKEALADVFADPEIASISAEDLLGDYPAVQYVPPSTSTSTSSRESERPSVSPISRSSGSASEGSRSPS